MNYVSWFAVLYFIASYIRLYPNSIYKCNSAKTWGWFSLLTIILAMSSVSLIMLCNDVFSKTIPVFWLVSDSNALLALLVGVATFMFFKNVNIPYSKTINTIGATTFGVLLIHANSSAMRHWLWYDTVDCIGHCADSSYYLYAPFAVLCIFSICSAIDFVRIQTVEKWLFNYLDTKWLRKDNKA